MATQKGSFYKVIAMGVLLLLDLGMNSSLDYDSYNDHVSAYPANFLLGLVGLQVIIEISVFLLLFLAMADTFLFRVGLLGLLLQKFKLVLLMHPIYIALTIATGVVRVNKIVNQNLTLEKLWRDSSFVVLSTVQKIGTSFILLLFFFYSPLLALILPSSLFKVAVLYSVLNLRASITLGESIYFDKNEWISRIRQQQQRRNISIDIDAS